MLLWLAFVEMDWRAFTTLACLGLSGLILLHAWRVPAYGRLTWDGQVWTWELTQPEHRFQASLPVDSPDVLLDLQSALLLRLKAMDGGADRCVWLERGSAQPRWLDLRRALYARRLGVAASSVTGQGTQTRPARG